MLKSGGKRTGLMDRGRRLQEERITRALELVPLKGYRALRRIFLRSERLGIYGVLDALLVSERDMCPLEVKCGSEFHSHEVQLAAYAMLAEEEFGLPVKRGFLYYDKLKEISITNKLRREVLDVAEKVRTIILEEVLPEPTDNIARCRVCEHYPFCRRI